MASMDASASNRFVQYFLVTGLDVNIGLEPDEVAASLDFCTEDASPLDRSYKPTCVRHYTDMSQPNHFHPEALSRLCLPAGLRFTSDRSRYPPACHPFVLTKEDGSRLCGLSLVYLEEVKDMNICHAMHSAQIKQSTGKDCDTIKKNERMRPSSVGRPSTARSRSLPRHYTTRLSGSNLDLSCAGSTYDYRKDTLYGTRSIALICSQPFIHAATQVLNSIYRFINKTDFDSSVLESFIYNLLYDIPIPSPGRSIRFWSLGQVATISSPKTPKEQELFDYPLIQFFDVLGVENSVKLLTCVLLEHQTLVFSSDPQKLMLVCESIEALCSPFQWPHVYVPILPPMLENFLDAPVPYIMGLLRRTHDMNLYSRAAVCIVDIDSGELEFPEELPAFPYEKELIQELESVIIQFGGREGVSMLKSQAAEQLEQGNNLNQRRGLDSSMDRLNQMIDQLESTLRTPTKHSTSNDHEADLRLNAVLREVFLNRFVHMFHSFQHFVIFSTEEEDLRPGVQNPDNPENFDKISFLSEQVQSHIGFLASFLETQMFSTFIDDYVQSVAGGVSLSTPFHHRLNSLKSEVGESLVHTPTYDTFQNVEEILDLLKKRTSKVELTVSPQKSTRRSELRKVQNVHIGVFPLFDPGKFLPKETDNSTAIFIRGDRRSRVMDVNVAPNLNIPILSVSQASIAETNWKFVNQLLKEAKQKTKRILLEKLGSESVEWGHKNPGGSGTEENILVGSLCDLLERIWAHGLNARQRKSALWFFLTKYIRHSENMQKFKGALGSQAFCIPLINSKPYLLPDHSRPVQVSYLSPVNADSTDLNLLAIMHNVSTINEIKTEIGYSRAWIRLALEQKVLAPHLAAMLQDVPLLRTLYRRYAFLRCEDEKEQTLYYLQDLNAVEFSCFTNAYFNSYILYQVLVFPSQKGGHSMSTANVWLHVVGSHAESEYLNIPRGVIHFSFWTRNLGVLTSLRIGHDSSGLSPNWLIEHILIRNEFTGHYYKFGCGRWLGKNMDDGSTERYLVATQVPGKPTVQGVREIVKECAFPPEFASPPVLFRSVGPLPDQAEIEALLRESINRLIKHQHRSLKERVSWALLMCGQNGLVHSLFQIFSYGFKSARLFGRNLTVWDFFLKVTYDFNQFHQPVAGSTGTPDRLASTHSPRNTSTSTVPRTTQLRIMYTRLITRIETTCTRLGKDDKFQLFVCLGVHDRLLQRIVADVTRAVATIQLYEEHSFLRTPALAESVTLALEALTEVEIPVDPALTKALEPK